MAKRKTGKLIIGFLIIVTAIVSLFFWINGSDPSVQREGQIYFFMVIGAVLIFLLFKSLKLIKK